MSDLARLRIWDDPAIRDGPSCFWLRRRTEGHPNFALPQPSPTQLDPANVTAGATYQDGTSAILP